VDKVSSGNGGKRLMANSFEGLVVSQRLTPIVQLQDRKMPFCGGAVRGKLGNRWLELIAKQI
jgi:hypothetical protein